MHHLFSLTITIILVALFSANATAAKLHYDNTPVLKSPPQTIVDQAAAIGIMRYNRNIKGGAHTNGAWGGSGYITLAVAAYAGNASADKPLLERIRYNLVGENVMTVTGTYPAQHERHFTGACTLAKLTPRVWNQLSDQEKYKIDLLMKAALVASAYTTSDTSYAGGNRVHGLDGNTNFHRDWNPNFQEGMIGMMIVGPVYFGPEKAKQILDNYHHEQFVAELRKAKLDNAYETFNWKKDHPKSNAPSGSEIEKNIRDYHYYSLTLDQPMAIYQKLTMKTYGSNVNAGLNGGKGLNGAGKIASGAENLPNIGKPGMLREFDSMDGGGPRSSIGYAYDGFRPNLTNQIVLIASGYWQPGPVADECLALLPVGITDLFYKLEHGYIDYSKGKASHKTHDINAPYYDYQLTRSLWNDVVKKYHGMQ